MRQTFGYGRFAHARFTDEDRVVLGTSGKDLEYTPYFFVAADDGVQFVLARQFVEVLGVFFEGLVGILLVLFGHPFPFAELFDGRFQVFFADVVLAEQFGCFVRTFEHGQDHMFHCDELVAHLGSDALGIGQHFGCIAREVYLAARYFGERIDDNPHLAAEVFGVHAGLAQQERQYALVRIEDALQDVHVLDLGVSLIGGDHLGLLDSLL